ncbi:substrate-binding domain-containing protein [Planctomyces sp. SH-PL14]|uniref:substrate-binding domain-containing protein n=1 Tax=Planctomyces sp. SH-PL14 TaxID=1632864 RepID=UPI00078C0707|nr:substrate-binding domain-containing protein [Planctomyces sp. SH-PL14]AMV18546.1 PBP superfamily domain protein [Planctomyces sp. SH-PL14]
MASYNQSGHRVRKRRSELGWTQDELARRAGISRSAVTAVEAERLVPSVEAALGIARALQTTVEALFSPVDPATSTEVWAWPPAASTSPAWTATVGNRIVRYPASSIPMWTPLPHPETPGADQVETLAVAGCDPAAGLLASRFAAVTGLRLLAIPRSSRQGLELLRDGLVHMAGLHLATADAPEANIQAATQTLREPFRLLRIATWQDGVVVSPTAKLRSVEAAVAPKVKWVGRETGSGARQCLDRIFDGRPAPRRTARDHRGVAEAIRSGWAEAGVCVELVSAEAGLDFLPVQQEAYDLCYPARLADDRRIKALVSVVRSPAYRRLLDQLPGYDTSETGSLWESKG